ncbi:hypothetical protein [Candidatus Nitrosocosmicus arcticus]|uniref:Uncharacterized protein n=1 Tax=Candidatus Nitrosocosmicus arcticus TaxID=2035267 RepID=A0A557STF6_9ARCH|nr:hypothetical protein [Candidatus Nitrosocosmicus arcticus]TVP39891.1 hypothetical protein NARC_110103 [Candidatus Nitrosocosmicus arcticus]
MDVKELLYSEIDQLGVDFIKTKIKDNILNSEVIIKQIFEKCAKSRGSRNLSPSDYISLAEALLHYLLAITITPSQRKININKIEVSILVPGARGLKNGGDKVLIIQFLKGDKVEYEHTVSDLLKIQPTLDNIWLVSYCPVVTPFPLRNFVINSASIGTKELTQPFSQLMIQINDFLDRINYCGFRII